jgi:hypothetical protein
MAGLIERKAKTPITIKQQTGTFVDSKPQYAEYSAKCMFFDASQEDLDYFGVTDNNMIFLIAPFETELKKGCQIVHDGKTYDCQGLRTIRNTSGEILGYKAAV